MDDQERGVSFLPLGSIVVLNNGTGEYMIVSRGTIVRTASGNKYYDYGACIYPKGMDQDDICFFCQDKISEVIYEGYTDEREQEITDQILGWKKQNGL